MAALHQVRRILCPLYALRRQFRQNRYYTRPRKYTTRNAHTQRTPRVLKLPPSSFFQAFWMTKSDLERLSALLGDDHVFARKGKRPQAPVLYQVGSLVYRMAHIVEVGMLALLFDCSGKLANLVHSRGTFRMLI